MNKEQKLILEPVAIVLAGINADLQEKLDEEILEMYDACEAVSRTNCWCFTYDAAQYLKPVLVQVMTERKIKFNV